MINKLTYNKYVTILNKELVSALGCTEPISLAYAGAIAKKYFPYEIETIDIKVSKNILKNVKSVVVPNTNGLRGISYAVFAGIIDGNPNLNLEVISELNKDDVGKIQQLKKKVICNVSESKSRYALDIEVTLFGESHSTYVHILNSHSNVVLIKQDENIILDNPFTNKEKHSELCYKCLNIKDIYEFSNMCKIADIENVIERQIKYNMEIALWGVSNTCGANVGKIILKNCQNDPLTKAKGYAASASDARMSGCDLPVIINSGSGNQGIACSIPVIIYGEDLKVSHEKLLRALVLSNLITIYLKRGIGKLSAYCGATSAGVGASAGICTLYNNTLDMVEHSIINSLVINSGAICDGAKASCAAKIASSIEAGVLGMNLALSHQDFHQGEGIVSSDVEKTIQNINKIVSVGMKSTDKEIIALMSEDC